MSRTFKIKLSRGLVATIDFEDLNKVSGWSWQVIERGKNKKIFHVQAYDSGGRNNTGIIGVMWDQKRKRYVAQIMVHRKGILLGRYKNKRDAVNARKAAQRIYFKT